MLRSHTHQLVSCSLLLLICVSSSGESRPHMARNNTPDVNITNSQKTLLLEAKKNAILSSLSEDREPRPTQKASDEELRKIRELYREKLSEMRGTSTPPIGETGQSTLTTVLFPATVEPLKGRQRGEHLQSDQWTQWYKAVFPKISIIHTELSLAQAALKISRQILNKPVFIQPEVRREVKVKVNGMKPVNTAAWTHIEALIGGNFSSTEDVMDISTEVEKWMRADGQTLIVDVGMVAAGRDVLMENPTISIEIGLVQPKPLQRIRRSNKEDECDERGWCCRKSVTVSFKDIGWTDWVVAPAEYTMHYCDGTCPHNYKPASMHTQVKSRLHQITKGETPRPCCVPAAYEPMVLMHYNSKGRLKLTAFNDLIVSKCHCA
ncbi:Growth/differentiation factor 15 [Channa argus]|uniref:Growth/differentiation factor 15 n=1 Tax=Channa argus TaxID=215402 RepID=A0A6G1Q952_CHAAH|nr:Growth/differentiation factor 15 [Channa argus]KAK2895458.1 hypothetical protein Q8A73_014946 [Channa argus]